MRLSKNFTLKELIKSDTAVRKGINNNPKRRPYKQPRAFSD
jgi:hypothetical protein